MYQVRTDLALEAREKFEDDHVEVKGVKVEEEKNGNMTVTRVVIETENGAKAMGKPRGSYITLEAPDMEDSDEDYHREISRQLADILKDASTERGFYDACGRAWKPGSNAGCAGSQGGGQYDDHKAYYPKVWQICVWVNKKPSDQQYCTRCDGTDRNGDA